MIKNLNFRLYLLIMVTAIPFILYLGYLHALNIAKLKQDTLDHLTTISLITAAEHKQIQEGARQLLIALSTNQSLKSKNKFDCQKFLSEIRDSYIRYENFGIVDGQGQVYCAADLENAELNPPKQELVLQTLANQTFTVGTYYPVAPSGSVINYAYPLDSNQAIYASLSLDWVSEFVNSLNTDDQLVINILDKDGTVLARSPKSDTSIGQNFVTDPLVKEILQKGSGQSTKLGIDQTLRLYAFSSLDEDKNAFIAVGTPQSILYTSLTKTILTSILVILIIILTSFYIANLIGRVLIVKHIENLQILDKLKDEFVSLASHQIRSPLTAIRWLTESLTEKSTNFSIKQKGSLKKIHITTLKLIDLASSLLNLSRLESGVVSPRYQKFNLSNKLKQITDDLAPLAKFSNLHFKISIPSRVQLFSDPTLVGEIFKIILGNSVKYSHSGSSIIIRSIVKDNMQDILITNHGIGIPKSADPHIFTRFYRADNARDHDPNGNGLGLYLALTIAKLLGGNLTYLSHKSSTTFTLSLPNEVR